jgi:hypothetical protein
MKRRKEVDYYKEIAVELVKQFEANLADEKYDVKPLIGEISSGLRTLIANGYDAGELLQAYSTSVHKLHLDISILIENTKIGKFEVIIFEIKCVNNLGLSDLSQLIGYCLVSKSKFGILMNVDRAVSSEFSVILDGDKDLTKIIRIVNEQELHHKFGVMVWNAATLKIEYTNSGSIKSIPQLIELVEGSLS